YWDLDVAGAGHATYGADVKADPLFVDTFDPADCSTEPYLQAGSPALGTGDPARADHDIGAYSAQTADPGPDNDGDGVPDGLDCEAEDATVYPGAWDNPLDDIDPDCDGEAARGVAHGGCGCATGVGTGGGAGLVAALGLLVAARRRGPIA
ncbi:MAG: MYXO-CTERM sorting domain-containing protein, partial [Candidatus Moranbacteria bacterium]|nr:MYXO-CTERM sorting domain-containing protein [Candidatus Moranbacteria bacterium]